MRTLLIILSTFFILVSTSTSVQGQEFQELLEPVYLDDFSNRKKQRISSADLHQYLLQKEDFSFRKEIKMARSHSVKVVLHESENSPLLSTVTYLKTLRRIGNKSATMEQFATLLSEEFEVTKEAIMALNEMEALYQIIRQNTFYGKLDIVGSELTWL